MYFPFSVGGNLNDIFEVNSPTVFNPGQNTTSLSADQTFQIARAVGLEVTLASYGLSEDLLLPACGVFSLSGRGEAGQSPFPCFLFPQ